MRCVVLETDDQMAAHSYAPFAASPAIGKLADALAKAQGVIKPAEKDRENPHFHSKYATLDACWAACRDALSKHGLSVVQLPSSDGAKVSVTTVLAHSSGEWISSTVTMIAKDGSPQSIGSALTYGRRYGLCSAVGVAPEEDDDGNAAQGAQAASNGRSNGTATGASHGQAAPTTALNADARLRVTGVTFKDGTTNGRPWRKYTVAFSDGSRAGTLNGEIGKAAEHAQKANLDVRPVLKRTQFGFDLEGLDVVREVLPPEPPAHLLDDEPPF